MKRSVTTDTEEIKEIMEKVGEEDQCAMREFLFGGKVVVVSGEATGKHSVYGAAVEVVVDKEFSDYLPHARSIIMWIGANNAALSDVQWFFAAIFRKTREYCESTTMLTSDKAYGDRVKIVVVAK